MNDERAANANDVARAIRILGVDLKTARMRRSLRLSDLAARSGVSVGTIRSLEAGARGVSIGALAAVLDVMNELRRIESLIDMRSDETGLAMEREHEGKRVRLKSNYASDSN